VQGNLGFKGKGVYVLNRLNNPTGISSLTISDSDGYFDDIHQATNEQSPYCRDVSFGVRNEVLPWYSTWLAVGGSAFLSTMFETHTSATHTEPTLPAVQYVSPTRQGTINVFSVFDPPRQTYTITQP